MLYIILIAILLAILFTNEIRKALLWIIIFCGLAVAWGNSFGDTDAGAQSHGASVSQSSER